MDLQCPSKSKLSALGSLLQALKPMNLKVIKRECYLGTAVRHKENETEKIFRNIYVGYFLCMFKQAMASRSFFIFLLVLLFVLSLSIILFELALTRIFSIVLWYDYAFMAISIAFFGLGIGSFMVTYPERQT